MPIIPPRCPECEPIIIKQKIYGVDTGIIVGIFIGLFISVLIKEM